MTWRLRHHPGFSAFARSSIGVLEGIPHIEINKRGLWPNYTIHIRFRELYCSCLYTGSDSIWSHAMLLHVRSAKCRTSLHWFLTLLLVTMPAFRERQTLNRSWSVFSHRIWGRFGVGSFIPIPPPRYPTFRQLIAGRRFSSRKSFFLMTAIRQRLRIRPAQTLQ